jgi:hypothetical protein
MPTIQNYDLYDVFTKGNSKLGKSILVFSIPAIKTCPGRSKLCERLCYADQGFFMMHNVKDRLYNNWKLSQKKHFAETVTELLNDVKPGTILRIHVAGDFYNAEYAEKWLYILKNSPHIKAFAYTRSWRVPEIKPTLTKLAKLPNLQLWFSCDKETGRPTTVPERARLAYLMTDDSDIPRYRLDVTFRDYPVRSSIMKRLNGGIVCPPENGISSNVHCEQCRICFTDPQVDPTHRTRNRFEANITASSASQPNRVALQLV